MSWKIAIQLVWMFAVCQTYFYIIALHNNRLSEKKSEEASQPRYDEESVRKYNDGWVDLV